MSLAKWQISVDVNAVVHKHTSLKSVSGRLLLHRRCRRHQSPDQGRFVIVLQTNKQYMKKSPRTMLIELFNKNVYFTLKVNTITRKSETQLWSNASGLSFNGVEHPACVRFYCLDQDKPKWYHFFQPIVSNSCWAFSLVCLICIHFLLLELLSMFSWTCLLCTVVQRNSERL